MLVARPSRPPGFDMTYRPTAQFFGPPLVQRIPSFVHLAVALGVAVFVLIVERGPRSSELYRYLFQRTHLISAHVVVAAFLCSAFASILRAGMRGVRVRGDFLEYRDMIASVWPKVRRIRWAQIDLIQFSSSGGIALELWDGSQDWLPRVARPQALAQVLERIARARAIPVRGGAGLDDLEADPELEEES